MQCGCVTNCVALIADRFDFGPARPATSDQSFDTGDKEYFDNELPEERE
jgi:hypothetical protein